MSKPTASPAAARPHLAAPRLRARCTPGHRTRSRAATLLSSAFLLCLCALAGGAAAELPDASRRIQIAGEPLDGFPHFEFVRAFQHEGGVQGAIDPALREDLAGRTVDVWVVEARTLGEWLQDDQLVDAAGGPRALLVSGGNVLQNRFELAAPAALDAGDRRTIGKGYDVVLDVDRDGRLGAADYVDGLDGEAGFYVVHDLTLPGPYAVDEVSYSGGMWRGQIVYYPGDIATMGALPLVVVSHGNGHDYTWYDHIGRHLASYGYVVMSHQNNVGPGPDAAATATIDNTEYLLANQTTLAGGVLAGHLDASRIVWIGHSRGAEGIARAIRRIAGGADTPRQFTLADLRLASVMAPTDFLKNPRSQPHTVPFHVWTGSADIDVDGSAACDACQTFHLHDRAMGPRHSTVIQGTGHGDFHAGPVEERAGACPVGSKEVVHDILRSHLLALIAHYVEGNVPATDFLWRDYERFHPDGVDLGDPCVVVSNEYRPPEAVGRFVVDDFQREPSAVVSSAGARVSFSVEHLSEGRLDDADATYAWRETDPFNGATQASARDDARGIVFDWQDRHRFIEWEVPAADADFSRFEHLSLRAAQATRHPLTLLADGPVTFSVTLRDRAGGERSIDIGHYGRGLVAPYARDGGWHNEMRTVRVRLRDFERGGGGPDLTRIAAVRLDFGPGWGSRTGRIVVDDLMVTRDAPLAQPRLDWRVALSSEVDDDGIAFDVEVAGPDAASFDTFLVLLGPPQRIVPLWSAPLPRRAAPRTVEARIPFALNEPAALLSGLFREGIMAFDLEFLDPDAASPAGDEAAPEEASP